MMKNRLRQLAAVGLSAAMVFTGTPYYGGSAVVSAEEKNDVITGVTQSSIAGYKQILDEEFDGDSLNTNVWNYELHDPGWVNNELQYYTNSKENVYVKDGKLIIQALEKVDGNGKKYYTSGRINTQNKVDFKYGRVDVKAKMPRGQGLWPAIWMMPTNERLYGQWPRCGEIDIMEYLGHEENKIYGTIHYGTNSQSEQSQGFYKLGADESFYDDYHVFSVEWEPSEIRFYLDGKLYSTENRWYTGTDGIGTIKYPAPFDQPFYVILNFAVGGNWPGNPDETTSFEGDNARMTVDYVKIYQKESGYDENVKAPEVTTILRDPDANGNYVINGDFKIEEDTVTENEDWYVLTQAGGSATATVKDGEATVTSKSEGTVDYAIQFMQSKIPMEQGKKYQVTFKAKAAEERDMVIRLTAPDHGYKQYLKEETVHIPTDWKDYSYTFDMISDSDANGRMEFNFGALNSLAEVKIKDVVVKQIGKCDVVIDNSKGVLSDGNYVYNGTFDQGDDRMKDWSFTKKTEGTKYHVTNENNVRELFVDVTDESSDITDVELTQSELGLNVKEDKAFELTFDAYSSTEGKEIGASIGEASEHFTLTKEKKTYVCNFTLANIAKNTESLKFYLGGKGDVFLDNVRLTEVGLLKNGDFSNALTGWSSYVNTGDGANASFIVDSQKSNEAAAIDINGTGKNDWNIQLQQKNIPLKAGKTYKLAFDAKSTIPRKLLYAIQHDGSSDDDWTPYTGSQVVDLTTDFKHFTNTFTMEKDDPAMLCFSAGSVANIVIEQEHTVFIDNVTLEEVLPGDSMIKNGDFSRKEQNWETAANKPGDATFSFDDSKLVVDVKNAGTENWHVQLKQHGIAYEQGKYYQVKMTLKSNVDRNVEVGYMGDASTDYAYYGGSTIALKAGETKTFDQVFAMESATNRNGDFVLSFGKVGGDTAAGIVEITDISMDEVNKPEPTVIPTATPVVPSAPSVVETQPPVVTTPQPTVKPSAKPSQTPKPSKKPVTKKVSISKASITGIKNATYTGKSIIQKLKVTVKGKELTKGKDYTVSYANNKNAGTAYVLIQGKGNYKGAVKKSFIIKKADQVIEVKASIVKKLGDKNFTLDVKRVKGKGKLSYVSSNTKVVKVSKKGKVSILRKGTAVIKVTAAGTHNYNKTSKTVKITVK